MSRKKKATKTLRKIFPKSGEGRSIRQALWTAAAMLPLSFVTRSTPPSVGPFHSADALSDCGCFQQSGSMAAALQNPWRCGEGILPVSYTHL
ncbi:MAG: hypothetical protein N3D11_17270, partial [Candidatus Sumerlaeia bacterium]|nr:hypothetical protein [Candidatus Sumerlaeia bacterium]